MRYIDHYQKAFPNMCSFHNALLSLMELLMYTVKATISLLPASQWRYVAIRDNPADIASRGSMPRELLSNNLWWEGPEWLSLSPQYWPIRLDIGDTPIDVNQPSPVPILTTRESEPDVVCRFSSFFHLSRFYAYAMRWLQRVRKKSMMLGPVTIQEIRPKVCPSSHTGSLDRGVRL